MDRVQEVVDYAYGRGVYVIVNIHHEDWHFPYLHQMVDISGVVVPGGSARRVQGKIIRGVGMHRHDEHPLQGL